jgi:hypothetical protein
MKRFLATLMILVSMVAVLAVSSVAAVVGLTPRLARSGLRTALSIRTPVAHGPNILFADYDQPMDS